MQLISVVPWLLCSLVQCLMWVLRNSAFIFASELQGRLWIYHTPETQTLWRLWGSLVLTAEQDSSIACSKAHSEQLACWPVCSFPGGVQARAVICGTKQYTHQQREGVVIASAWRKNWNTAPQKCIGGSVMFLCTRYGLATELAYTHQLCSS